MSGELRVLLTEDGADAEQVSVLTGHLRSELLRLDVDEVSPITADELPEGARALDVAVIGGLIVAVGQGVQTIGQVVSTILGWLGRGSGRHRKVRIELDGDVLELAGATDEQQQKLIEAFVTKHSKGESG